MKESIDTPLVSIIIPNYNRGSLIVETINSVLDQSYLNWELIIVDDGSTDDSELKIRPYLYKENIYFYNRPSNRLPGGNAARNYGLEKANGEFIKWLDSDDLLAPNCIEEQIKILLKESADVNFCRSRLFKINIESSKIELGSFWHKTFPRSKSVLKNFITGKTRFSNNDGLWRREVLGEEPYNEDLRNSQEFLMIIKILCRVNNVSLLDEPLVYVRQHENQMADNRTYAAFCKNQCLARHLAIKELKSNKIKDKDIYKYLLKSISYYTFKPIKDFDFKYLDYNFLLLSKSSYMMIFNLN